MPSPGPYSPRPIPLAEARSHSYTAVDVDETSGTLERSTTPPLHSPFLRGPRPTPPSSPQLKYREFERQGSYQMQRAPSWAREPKGPSRMRRLCGFLLTAVPLAGTALLVLQTLSSHGPQPSSLRSPHEIYAYSTPFPEQRPYERHPIHQLMTEADQLWHKKVNEQSGTYQEAVQEYRRRNGRAPPKGFDVW